LDYKYVPLPSDGSIRLLELAPGTDESIICRLFPHNINEGKNYEALSYVWGDSNQRMTITCEGSSLSIPKSLHVALKRFRLKSSSRVLWADAICINQRDDLERSQQVALMGQIYSNATMVLAWLGED
ncbi:heterokaryon incompatibility protein-domain-containing protein, partial [Bisporella sp. PMI_857]